MPEDYRYHKYNAQVYQKTVANGYLLQNTKYFSKNVGDKLVTELEDTLHDLPCYKHQDPQRQRYIKRGLADILITNYKCLWLKRGVHLELPVFVSNEAQCYIMLPVAQINNHERDKTKPTESCPRDLLLLLVAVFIIVLAYLIFGYYNTKHIEFQNKVRD